MSLQGLKSRCEEGWFLLEAPGRIRFLTVSSFQSLPASFGLRPHLIPILSGLILQPLEAGFSSWPEIEVSPWWWEHQILPAKPRVSDRALTLRLCRKELPQSWKVVKQVSVFRRKKNTACVYRHASGLRELCPRGCLNHLYGAFLPGVLWAISLICLSWVHLWYISESSQVCTSISQLRWILPKRPMGG